ncbi:hypothetical protein BDEG_22644 [Batrachochytrium dendrobatidis JEL423]|uniref:Peptidase A1 domain-containing protein n=1 Tax=Batrachochytrium dendrobatidis (strain JEL423) TaxID=403673 RepID=A0A177WF64_BATDL|nr:hypothetical protein BDEG_22644 [Batrachochytrium dendrobatidis JEL423]
MYQIQTIFITLLYTMLITIECVILALQAVAAIRLALHSPFESASPSNNRLSKRSPVELGGDITKCYTMRSNVNGVNLNLQVNSAAPGIIAPLPSSSNYAGLAPESTPSGEPVAINYKGEEYRGFSSTAVVTIPGTRITGINLPVILVEKQSPDLVGINPKFDGVFGFGYLSLSSHYTSVTAMDALYSYGVIPNNEISIQLCSYDMLQDSFINIGNTDVTAKCGTDGKSVAWVNSPIADQFTVDIKSILINGKNVNLPAEFQQVVENGLVTMLIDAILDSGAITVKNTMLSNDYLDKRRIKKRLKENRLMSESTYNINWDKMPTISITMHAETPVTYDNSNSVVTIELGPRDYMQRIDSKYVVFAVKVGPNYKATLGISFMTRLGLVFDRKHARIGFGPGCGCKVVTDGYPIISNSDQVLWSPSQLPEQPSGSSSDGTSTLRRSLSRLGSTLRDSIRRGSRRSKPNYEKFED